MKYRKIRNKQVINQMNVVPYIDVILVLLVIFMITAPMFVPKILNLPSVGTNQSITSLPIEISISIDNKYELTYNNKTYTFKETNSIINQIKLLLHTQDAPIVVSADQDLKYKTVMNLVNILHLNGIKKIALVVKS